VYATDLDSDPLTFGIVGGTAGSVSGTVVASNIYGELTLETSTGNYVFVLNSATIEPLTTEQPVNFDFTVTDGKSPPYSLIHTIFTIIQSGVTESINDDYLAGDENNNTFNALAGNDTINGWTGADTMIGGTGNDTYVVDNAGDFVWENPNEGTDTVYASISYALTGNVEQLYLTGTDSISGWGNTENNLLVGNSSDNQLFGWTGADTMVGGGGNDVYVVENSGDFIWENANEGTADMVWSEVNYWLANNVENLYLGAAAALAVGNEGNNLIVGNGLDNVLNGLGGADTFVGGGGNDTYVIDNSGDYAWENPADSATTDTVYSSVTYWLGGGIEQTILTGTAAIDAVGNSLANTLVGNEANNTLDGGAGADVLVGGKGNDSYVVDSSSDFIWEVAGEGSDTVYASVSLSLAANLETLILTGAATDGTGNDSDNYLIGNTANNSLIGWTGSDVLMGGQGKDTINLFEPVAATDTVYITTGDSLVSAFDLVTSFTLGGVSGADRLDLDSTIIAANTAGVDGIDVGLIRSHSISNGIISFDDSDSYSAPVAVTAATNLLTVLGYLQTNITGFNTVAFVSEGNTFVFQDGAADTLVELVGVTASSLSNTGAAAGSVWMV
jgi:Ca2+-binding RTX toxin-like protein